MVDKQRYTVDDIVSDMYTGVDILSYIFQIIDDIPLS